MRRERNRRASDFGLERVLGPDWPRGREPRSFRLGLTRCRRLRPIVAARLSRRLTLATPATLAASAAVAVASTAAAMVATLQAELHRRHIVELRPRDRLADQRFDGGDGLAVLGRRDGIGTAVAPRAAGAADAMHVVLGMVRHVEIEHVGQALDVEAACGHVAADQEADLVVFEALKRLRTLRLRHVTVERRHVEAVLRERAIEYVHVALAVAEDQRVLHVLVAQQAPQRL